MKYFPLQEKRTLITNLQSPRTVAEAIAESRNAAADGADAIAIELRSLRREDRNEDSFRAIIQSVPLPFMFLLYRNDQVESLADEPRQETAAGRRPGGGGHDRCDGRPVRSVSRRTHPEARGDPAAAGAN